MARYCLFILVLVLATTARISSTPKSAFCSQVHQMELQCTAEDAGSRGQDVTIRREGKAGPRGPPGSPGIVNYTEIYANIKQEFEDIEARIDAKLAKYDSLAEDMLEMKKGLRSFSMTDCGTATSEDTNTWDGEGGLVNIFLNGKTIEVYCDLTTDGGGWTVIQRRINGSVNFNRNWYEYAAGFGDKEGEFWLGLDLMHEMTKSGNYELRVELSDKAGDAAYARYGSFSVAGSSDNYRITVGDYSGNAGDSMAYHNSMRFSTPEKDLDTWSKNCASFTKGAWWFKSCMHSHLNGDYAGEGDSSAGQPGIYWNRWRTSESLKASEMKIRKRRV